MVCDVQTVYAGGRWHMISLFLVRHALGSCPIANNGSIISVFLARYYCECMWLCPKHHVCVRNVMLL